MYHCNYNIESLRTKGFQVNKRDIENRADIELVMKNFYVKLLGDEEMNHLFNEVVKIDLESHMPILADFWEGILFHRGGYKRNTMAKHLNLNIKYKLEARHFKLWLNFFNESVDEMFQGNIADQAKTRALSIATVMQFKIHDQNLVDPKS